MPTALVRGAVVLGAAAALAAPAVLGSPAVLGAAGPGVASAAPADPHPNMVRLKCVNDHGPGGATVAKCWVA